MNRICPRCRVIIEYGSEHALQQANKHNRLCGSCAREKRYENPIEREKTSLSMRGENNPFWGKKHNHITIEKLREINTGKKLSNETRQKMSASGKGRSKSEEHKRKIALANTGNIGSAQKRAKISAARKGKSPSNKGVTPPKYSCPHCKSIVSMANLNRWHGNFCKLIDPKGHTRRTFQVAAINRTQ